MLLRLTRNKFATGAILLAVGVVGGALSLALPRTGFPQGFVTGVCIGLAIVGGWMVAAGRP